MERLYNRRKRGHDYYGPFIYHIILKKQENAPDFGEIVGNASIEPGKPGCARVNYFKPGYAVYHALREFEAKFPEFLKKQYSIMPDHVHLILQKLKRTERHLEVYMNILKDMVVENFVKEGLPRMNPNDIFEHRFTDKLLYRKIKLDTWIEYVGNNPHRRAMILQRPYFFQKKRSILIGDKFYEAYGNLFLFRNPDKYQVRIRRHFSSVQADIYERFALEKAGTASILVSPFISNREKIIRENALKRGGKLIIIKHEEFGDFFKPHKAEFELCCQGRLLLISLGLPKGTPLTYKISTEMNELAEKISGM